MMCYDDSLNTQSIDLDPQLFEGLLLHNTPGGKLWESDGRNTITVKDLRSIGGEVRSQEYVGCLRGYMFNMPLTIVDTVAKMIEKSLDQKECTTSPTSHILSGTPPSYEEITGNISRLMLEREKRVEEGLPTNDVDTELKRLQQKRKMLSSERYI